MEEAFPAAGPIFLSKYPFIARYFAAGLHDQVTPYVVLREGGYETSFGDGEFHYNEMKPRSTRRCR